ncbi:hypothetical protein M0R04_04150 [Candidatus Dojkabacteria bacterium]|jgi:hypothetical protein|nr:hypothetical protein [Candidatus Dojkabacteria bacterium]
MNLDINKSLQFKINELVIVTKFGEVDITDVYTELNLYDSIFLPVISGKVLITDAKGLSNKLMFDGSEAIRIDISKSENSDIAGFRNVYRIYKQTDRVNVGMNSVKYILHFVADELIFSDQKRITQVYEMTYKQTVERILTDYLKVPEEKLKGFYSDSSGVRRISIPNLKPLDALTWCAKRAVDSYNSPNFLFFQNSLGFNFTPLSNLLSQPDILNIKFQLKNTKDSNPILEMSNARSLEVVSQMNAIDRVRSGVDAGKFVGFDPMTRMVSTKNVSYADHYGSMSHGNDTPGAAVINNRDGVSNMEMFDSKKTVSIFGLARQLSNYIKKYDPTSISKEDDTENYKHQRLAILQNLINKRVKLVMPGNFQLTSGFNVSLQVPNFSEKEKGASNEDTSVSGKYIIVATRHIISFDKHETIIEVASTSSTNDGIYSNNLSQTNEY